MMKSALALLSASGLRRAALWLTGIVVACGFIALRFLSAGRDDERARQKEASLKNMRSREETDDAVERLDDADRRQRLSRWVRDEQ